MRSRNGEPPPAEHTTRSFTSPVNFWKTWDFALRADRAHAYLWMRLNNCGDAGVENAAADLQTMRRHRNHADYDLHIPLKQTVATGDARLAGQIIQTLAAAAQEPTRTQITDAIRIYKRDVLKDVTYQKP